ncbi:bifunctional diaminohydroxyphosphoribosylaminopyrimidine deaminase/5-amino-6-(5-phosphoribosylamino)uracil reductase RibD [Commensalibacter oyaizuii]|uniref:Riboflavin biosynthesis protein RibD n=1 Tax=Commensalibacter oyaizuii TaxID=3043873 RepID=A0ABT6Q577_9PROT|nr:bifunctional diaminohydroxyphosphoribosylaminopyrimidine deaminase/5-amino-6-(5-phosphoribosylamino)uracil reductase RibD [Commensalibacter sp. TBRC 16381]MDI2091706.1 bifunctional diaminohydroxyphosphoribosylaminopyrimidine deaminase/5-amino-6-(5-phosphoribosylamino)uracil reductase RibD [Commensalibacter sp. TBRC 16381]
MQARIVSTLTNKVEVEFTEKIINGFRHAVNEALLYVGRTAPNPPVGCAILDKNGHILTVAAHHQAGDLHAEALALKQCQELGVWDQICDVIVTLEPCNHVGRTPPCSEAIIRSPAKRVWIGVKDPNPDVCGAGYVRLREAGKDVILLQNIASDVAQYWHQQCQDLLAPFAKAVVQHKTWITVKQALTSTGSMYPPKGQKTFTSVRSLRMAHQLRRATEAVVTGMNTITIDNPSFTVRHVSDHPKIKRLLVVCSQKSHDVEKLLPSNYRKQAESNGFSIIICNDLDSLSTLLWQQHRVLWAMVEAGPQLLQEIRQKQIWDEWLTIRQNAQKENDEVSVISKHNLYPTRQLLLGANQQLTKEGLCSLVS